MPLGDLKAEEERSIQRDPTQRNDHATNVTDQELEPVKELDRIRWQCLASASCTCAFMSPGPAFICSPLLNIFVFSGFLIVDEGPTFEHQAW